MDAKYNISKFDNNNLSEIKDFISIEEPLQMDLKFKKGNDWSINNISITMRTPGNDEDLISGFLFNEKIIDNISDIEKIEKIGDPVGDFNIQNTIQATIKNSKNIEIDKLKRNFLTNSLHVEYVEKHLLTQ